MRWATAVPDDARMLAEMNAHLIEDQHHPNPMSISELEARMAGWLSTQAYVAIVFGTEPSAYALYRLERDGGVYLRQFFVARELRRRGIGRRALELLRTEIWPVDARVTLDVLLDNHAARAFWHAVGFREYAVLMELRPMAGREGRIR
jgi:GNAT superfamily N-acetyltransferase